MSRRLPVKPGVGFKIYERKIMLFRIWSIIKFTYLHICYFCVGLEDEEFLIPKANYCTDIGWYNLAIKIYKKALNESSDPYIHSALGWCYSELRMDEESVKHYRIAFKNKNVQKLQFTLLLQSTLLVI